MTNNLMTSREVAEMFRVDVTCVRRWVVEGKLEVAARTPGGQLRFSKADVDALASARMPSKNSGGVR